MATELIINASLPETRIALLEDGHIQELMVDHAGNNTIVGNIYKGRVTRVLPGMQAAFVDIGLDKAAFLYVDDVYVHPEVFNRDLLGDEVAEEPNREVSAEPSESTDSAEGEGTSDEQSSLEREAEGDELAEQFDDADESGDDGAIGDDEPAEEMSEDPKDAVKGETVSEGESGQPSEAKGDSAEVQASGEQSGAQAGSGDQGDRGGKRGRGRFRRGRGGRDRGGERGGRGAQPRVTPRGEGGATEQTPEYTANEKFPESVIAAVAESGSLESDRAGLDSNADANAQSRATIDAGGNVKRKRPEFREGRDAQKRTKPRRSLKPERASVSIDELLKEGQEVLVQVAKDPIASKGARLTCHISLAGRHLVCMPTINHVGVSRRIERDDDRRRLRDYVEKNRPGHLGFIVRTATSKRDPESWIKADMDYLELLWTTICEKAAETSAPSLIYQDLNPVLRAVRDWIAEDVKRVLIDTRDAYEDLKGFVDRFMPSLSGKIELYQGDIPVFDAYNISNEIHRALERKVWLKSGGYLVVDQAEALVAIDVNTGRYVGKKNLEDTILKTNLEAVEEIAYQLRLRNCGGIIILDLIDMEKEENRHRVLRALEVALEKDRARPTILRMSELGLIEMTRKRTRDTLVRTLCQTCNQCEGKGFVKNHATVANEILREIERAGIERDMQRILVQASPDVIEILAIGHQKTIETLERRFKKQIFLQEVADFHQEQFEVSGDMLEHKPRRDIEPDARRDRERGRNHRRGQSTGGRGRSEESRESSRSSRDRGAERNAERGPDRARVESPAVPPSVVPRGKVIVRELKVTPKDQQPQPEREQGPAEPGNQPSVQTQTQSQEIDDDSYGNRAPRSPVIPRERPEPSAQGNGADDFSDEDRIAYLRAQAAQDAAIAGVAQGNRGNRGNGGSNPGNGNGNGNGRGGGGGGGRHRRGGRGRDRYRHA